MSADIGQLASLARTALDDPAGLPDDDEDVRHVRRMEGKAILTSDDPFVLYAIDRLDDIIAITDPELEDRETIAASMSQLGQSLGSIADMIERLIPDTEEPDTAAYEQAWKRLSDGLDAVDEAIDALKAEDEDEPYQCEDCAVNGDDCRTHGEAFKIATRAIHENPERVVALLTRED